MSIKAKKSVLFLIPSLDSGGIQRYLLRFIIKYHNQLDIVIICKNNKLGELESEYRLYTSRIYKLKLGSFNIFNYFRFYIFLKKNNFDTICDFTGNFAALPLLMSKWAKVKNRVTFYRGSTNRFDDTNIFKKRYNSLLQKVIPSVSTKILSNSEAAFNFFFKDKWKNNNKFEVIYNGVNAIQFQKSFGDLRQELNIPQNAFVVGHTGRYDKSKNFNTLFKVAQKLCQSSPDNFFIFCGRNTDTKLSERINKLKLQNQVFALGYRSDIPRVLNTLNCFYFPSHTEGQPNSLLEALISDIPFIASNIESINEIIPSPLKQQLIEPDNYQVAIKMILELKQNQIDLRKPMEEADFRRQFDDKLLFKKFFEQL